MKLEARFADVKNSAVVFVWETYFVVDDTSRGQ